MRRTWGENHCYSEYLKQGQHIKTLCFNFVSLVPTISKKRQSWAKKYVIRFGSEWRFVLNEGRSQEPLAFWNFESSIRFFIYLTHWRSVQLPHGEWRWWCFFHTLQKVIRNRRPDLFQHFEKIINCTARIWKHQKVMFVTNKPTTISLVSFFSGTWPVCHSKDAV